MAAQKISLGKVQGPGTEIAKQPGEQQPPCEPCVEARHQLAVMHQTPTWGRYHRDEGICVLDIEDDPGFSTEEKHWLAAFREQTPSMLGPTEVIAFVARRHGEESEVIVPHERLAALAIIASSPGPVRCCCGQVCGPRAAVVACDRDEKLAVYCSPLCHRIQTNPDALVVHMALFGARPKSDIWNGDPDFTAEGQKADEKKSEKADEKRKPINWNQALAALHAEYEEFDAQGKQELFKLYTKSKGELTLKVIGDMIGVDNSTISRWFEPFRK